MTAFFAILKDSYREAREGFTVYVMLGMIALLFVITASLSFIPAPAPKAFETLVQRFQLVFPERGASKVPVEARGAEFKVADVKELAPGRYAFKLLVEGKSGDALSDILNLLKDKSSLKDGLRLSVVNWQKPAGATRKFQKVPGVPDMQVATMQAATSEELKAVTDDQIIDFIRHQFHLHAGIDDVRMTRTAAVEPKYAFDVEASTGSGVRGWPHSTKIFFGSVTVLDESPLGFVLWVIEDQIVNGFGGGLMLLISTIVTAFFIPNLLRKGSLDLLITKPVARWQVLLYKYLGGLTFIGLLSAIAVGGVWLILGWRSGYWDPRFLLLCPIITFTFAVLYAVSTLVAVLTRNGVVAIIVTVGFAFLLYLSGLAKVFVDSRMSDPVTAAEMPSWAPATVNTLHLLLPRYKDLDRIATKLISDGTLTPLESFVMAKEKADFPHPLPTFGASALFIAVMLGLAMWRFCTRDG